MTAGTNVMATTRATATASAIAGPKVRTAGDDATSSAPTPAATVSPAAATIGANVATLRRAATSRGRPSTSSPRSPDRKYTT